MSGHTHSWHPVCVVLLPFSNITIFSNPCLTLPCVNEYLSAMNPYICCVDRDVDVMYRISGPKINASSLLACGPHLYVSIATLSVFFPPLFFIKKKPAFYSEVFLREKKNATLVVTKQFTSKTDSLGCQLSKEICLEETI